MTSEEREAHIRAVVDSAPLPSPEDTDRLRVLLQPVARPAAGWSRGMPRQTTAAKAA